MQEEEEETSDVLTVVMWDAATGYGLDDREFQVSDDLDDDSAKRLGYSIWAMYHSGFQESLSNVYIEICREDQGGIRILYVGSPWTLNDQFKKETIGELFNELCENSITHEEGNNTN